ncbi:hypothetical protein [Qaidamihabitans albus]|uniref:hypothetical protein n=1 Tax=Qaidamihabitans albus TaxID=2795733 RepID=UPI0018F11349|nr:hypothetical protein [Qaidamihabitans albus]
MSSGSTDVVVLDLLRELRRLRRIAAALLGAGGLVVTALAVAGAVGGDLARLQGLVLGLPMIAFAALLVVALGRQKLLLTVGPDGFGVEQEPIGGFSVAWKQVRDLRVLRERRRLALVFSRQAYTLELTPAGKRFGGRLEDLRDGKVYRYALGEIGAQGRRAEEVLRAAKEAHDARR